MKKQELEKISDFALGEENLGLAPYFIGKSSLTQTSHIIIEQNHRKSDVANIKIA